MSFDRRLPSVLIGAALAMAAASARAGENLAAPAAGGRLVYFSSQYDDTEWNVENLFDGSPNQGWAGSAGSAQSIVIAFKSDALANVEGVIINPYTSEPPNTWAKDIEIQVSTTYPFKGFRSVGKFTVAQEARDQSFSLAEPAEARYVKLVFLTNYGDAFMEAGELQVLGTLTAGGPPAAKYENAAAAERGAKILVVTSEYKYWPASNLLAPDGGDGWATESTVVQEVVIALREMTPITDISIDNYARGHSENWAKTVEVELSTKANKGFHAVGRLTLPQIGDLHTLSLATPVEARYVKVRFDSNYGGEVLAANRVRVWKTEPAAASASATSE